MRTTQNLCNNEECFISDINQNDLVSDINFKLLIIFITWILLMTILYLNWPRNKKSLVYIGYVKFQIKFVTKYQIKCLRMD